MRVLSALLAACVLSVALALPESQIQLDTGVVQGVVTPMARVFRAIPYAIPPVGQLRWTDPQPAQPWAGVLDGTNDGPGCMQKCLLPEGSHACPPQMSEDCLTVTLFTPRLSWLQSKPLPVMVFIHGGNFFQGYGGGPLYDGSYFANFTNTIIVSVNYRLGALGFLATGTDIHGNFGTRDQLLALQWVQRNAKNFGGFGGDPNQVTLFGQSAGAISTAVLLTNPAAKGLFHKVIMQSEPFTLPIRDSETMPPLASAFAKALGCAVGDAACMRGKAATDVVAAQVSAQNNILASAKHLLELFLPWTPMVDGKLIADQPMTLLLKGQFDQTIPVMTGNTRGECFIFIWEASRNPMSKTQYEIMITAILGLKKSIAAQLMYPLPPNTTDARAHLSVLATDYIFLCSTRNVTRTIASMTPTWYYDFQHIPSFVEYAWQPETECYTEVCHGTELPFVFDSARPFVNYTADEATLSMNMLTYWANFARTGTPNGNTPSLQWPQYDSKQMNSIAFDTPSFVQNRFQETFCDFWDQQGYGIPPAPQGDGPAALERFFAEQARLEQA